MNVIVAAVPGMFCSAHYALRMEGIYHSQRNCSGMYAYGELLSELWRKGKGFVLVEHDIVPWPGAIAALIRCEGDWCAHLYPMHLNQPPNTRARLGGTIGCMKFSDHLVRTYPDVPKAWEAAEWHTVDGRLTQAVGFALGPEHDDTYVGWHEHTPPVAHVRRTM